MAEKRDWHSLTEAEQKTVLNRSAIGNIFIVILFLALILMLHRIFNDGAWLQPLIVGIVVAVVGNFVLPDVELPEGVYGRSWLRSVGYVFLLGILGAGIGTLFVEESALRVEPAIPQRKAAVAAPQQKKAAIAMEEEGPTFDETREWILAKYEKYLSLRKSDNGSSESKGNAAQFSDTVAKGHLRIDSCHIASYNVTAVRWMSDGEETFFSSVYADFKLKDIEQVSHYQVAFTEYSAPRFEILFSTSGTVKDRSRSGKITDGHSRVFEFHFDNDESEIGIEDRMKKAFFRLRDLAESNPDCADAIETF